MRTPTFSFGSSNSAMMAWMPGTAILLPHVEMNPVTATVSVIFHFWRFDQLRGLADDVGYEASVSAAARAVALSPVVLFCSGGRRYEGVGTGLGAGVGPAAWSGAGDRDRDILSSAEGSERSLAGVVFEKYISCSGRLAVRRLRGLHEPLRATYAVTRSWSLRSEAHDSLGGPCHSSRHPPAVLHIS